MSQGQHEHPAAAENGNDNNSSIAGSEWTLEEADTNDGDGDNENGLNRHQLMELEITNLKARVQMLENVQERPKMAAKPREEMAMGQKLQDSRQYCLRFSKLKANVLKWLNKIQNMDWLGIFWILLFLLVALSAYLSMTGKTKVANPKGNYWVQNNRYITISPDGHKAKSEYTFDVIAAKGFPIYWANSAPYDIFFNGTILYYYEIAQLSSKGFRVGLSDGSIPDDAWPGRYRNSYAIDTNYDFYLLSGKEHKFERPYGAVKPTWNGPDVIGCGLLLNSKNEVAIFFTVNGILQGTQIPINPSGDRLYPTVKMYKVDLEANFGYNPANPFKYDIKTCPGLVFH